jgi:hypothetical protein
MMVRIYYDQEKAHPEGHIAYPLSGDTLTENPLIDCSLADSASVSQVQFLGKYRGYDENGDGFYYDWHRAYHGPDITGHLGTRSEAPYQVVWDTRYVPDQDTGSIAFMARIQDTTGIWYVPEIVDSLTLARSDSISVRLMTAVGMSHNFVIRAGNTKRCYVRIDTLAHAMKAYMYHRTWNAGDDEAAGGTIEKPLRINDSPYYCKGNNHNFALSVPSIAMGDLHTGLNTISYSSNTVHHGIEVLWPGPAIVIRYVRDGQQVAAPQFSPPDSSVFEGILQPSITSATEGSTIYVTTDGRDPNPDDLRFRPGFLRVERDMTVKARAFKTDYYESGVAAASYLLDHTGLESLSPDGILFYPNPAHEMIRLAAPQHHAGGSFRITDAAGRLHDSGILTGEVIHTEHLQPGHYILWYQSGERTFSGNLIIED